ncbi:hypothetical protein HXX76_010644 [Chlamydomonas incerta]|uniref:Uncharacterized protein n=1 Tax=Chlamydomonas incerta TaxID=51695 RepID=A0A835SMS0_CHLIN|nr:hypothetical protein HXX76_010644 [Chlamydomonas incerta]|eukprot:KAG2429864.1 hypothetical protein HXX76_010644 [Chlamydomonas incerta]
MLQDFLRVHPEVVECTTEAVVKLVALLTREHQCSYAELPPSPLDDGTFFGPATHFVSHARSCGFGEIIDAIKCEEAAEAAEADSGAADRAARPTRYYWIDVFAMNHTPQPARQQQPGQPQESQQADAEAQELVQQLEGVVRGCGTTLALLSPWDAPAALRQAWCLFEHMVALAARGPAGLKYVTGSAQDKDRVARIGDRFHRVMQQVSSVDVRAARAAGEAERAAIVARLSAAALHQGAGGGIDALNAGVRAALQQWLRDCVGVAAATLSQEHGPDDSRVAALRELVAPPEAAR